MTVTAGARVAAHAGASCEELALMREAAARMTRPAPPASRETAAALRAWRRAAGMANCARRADGAGRRQAETTTRCPAPPAYQKGHAPQWTGP
jgi:hypothetical protein